MCLSGIQVAGWEGIWVAYAETGRKLVLVIVICTRELGCSHILGFGALDMIYVVHQEFQMSVSQDHTKHVRRTVKEFNFQPHFNSQALYH